MSPDGMNPSIKPEELIRANGSFPNNPLIAEVLYQAHYIEKMGSNTTDMIRLCYDKNLLEARFEMGRHASAKSLCFVQEDARSSSRTVMLWRKLWRLL